MSPASLCTTPLVPLCQEFSTSCKVGAGMLIAKSLSWFIPALPIYLEGTPHRLCLLISTKPVILSLHGIFFSHHPGSIKHLSSGTICDTPRPQAYLIAVHYLLIIVVISGPPLLEGTYSPLILITFWTLAVVMCNKWLLDEFYGALEMKKKPPTCLHIWTSPQTCELPI